MQPPKLEKRPKKHKFHSHEIEDDYNYLEENWQEIVKDPKKLPKTQHNLRQLFVSHRKGAEIAAAVEDLEGWVRIANAAAAVVVGKPGTATVTIDEINNYISVDG